MSDYNLDEKVADSFSFTLGGHIYNMRYPNTEEIQKSQKLENGSDEQMNWLYGFISSEAKEAPLIKDAMSKMNVKKLQLFTKMIQTEFGVETES